MNNNNNLNTNINNQDKKTKILVFAFALCLIALAIGATYAFFSASVNNTNGQKISIQNGSMLLVFSDGDNGISANLTPGENVTKKFTLENTGTLDACGKINWTSVVNTYTDGSLTWDLQESDSEEGTYTSIATGKAPTKDEELADGLCLAPKEKRYYNLIVTLNNLKDVDQTKDKDAHFSSYFNMVAGSKKASVTSATDTILSLVKGADPTSTDAIGDTGLAYDGTTDNNLRYIGANPNNYVKFNDELWRIIGVFNNIGDGTGKKETRLKIIRNESLGSYSWDSSASGVNGGYGVNEWSDADLQKELNTDYLGNITIGTDGNWYNGQNNSKSAAKPTTTLSAEAQGQIDNAVWNLGANPTENDAQTNTPSKSYTFERGTVTGKSLCSSGNHCNDTVTRTTTWTGKVALMYPSDYGYATSGGSSTNRVACLAKEMYNWDGVSDCYTNDWLFNKNNWKWTLSPRADSSIANNVFYVYTRGFVYNIYARTASAVQPAVFLKFSISITGGTGSSQDPYVLSLN